MTSSQVAATYQVSARTLRRWVRRGLLPQVTIGGVVRVRRADVEALYAEASAIEPEEV